MARKLVWVYSPLRRRIDFRPARTSSTERTGPGSSAFKASADRPAQKNATSDIISSQPIVCPSDQSWSWSHVFTDQEGRKCVLQNSRLLWFQSLLCRPSPVVGSGVFVDCKVAGKASHKEREYWRHLQLANRVSFWPIHEAGHVMYRLGHEVYHVIHRTRRSEVHSLHSRLLWLQFLVPEIHLQHTGTDFSATSISRPVSSRLLWYKERTCPVRVFPEVGHVIHWPGHEADRHLQSANHVVPLTSKLVMWHTNQPLFLNIDHKGFPSNCQIYK